MFFVKNNCKHFSDQIKLALKKHDGETVFNMIEGMNIKEIKDSTGYTILHLSIRMNSNKITNCLIDKGCDINAQDQTGTTPLILAIKFYRHAAIKKLLEKKANIFLSDNKGTNALKAVSESHHKYRNLLINIFAPCLYKYEANVNKLALSILEAGWPIHYAIHIRDPEIINFMLESGSAVDSYDTATPNYTALFTAVLSNDAKCVEILLKHGANPNIRNEKGNTPFSLAFDRAHVLEKFLDHGNLLERFKTDRRIESFTGFSRVNEDVLKLLLKNKVNLTVKDTRGNTLLHMLVGNYREQIINLISETNFDANIRNDDEDTLLHVAAKQDNLLSMKMLIDKGADVNAKNKNGDTPLTILIKSFSFQNTYILLEKGAILCDDTQNLVLTKVHGRIIAFEDLTKEISHILQHMAIMHFKGNTISSRNLGLLKSMFHGLPYSLFEVYLQELHLMEVQRITGNSDISLLDIFFASKQQLVNYVRNEEIVHNYFRITSGGLSLPFFGKLLEIRFKSAIVEQKLIEGTVNTLSKNIEQLKCNLYVIHYIVKFLEIDDLQRLAS